MADPGLSLVEAETVGDRGRLTAASDPQLGEDPGDVDAGRLLGDEEAWPICRLVRPSAIRTSTSVSRRVSPSDRATEGAAASVTGAGWEVGSSRTRPRWARSSSSRRSDTALVSVPGVGVRAGHPARR